MIAIASTPSASSGYTIAPPYLSACHATPISCITRFSLLTDASCAGRVSWRLRARGLGEWKFPFYSAVYRAARAELIGEHADTGAVSYQISPIGEIHDRAAKFEHAAIVGYRHALGDAGVDLDIEWQVSRVGEAGSKSAAVDPVNAEHPATQIVRCSGGVRKRLIVIQKNIVTVDVFQFVRREVELPRFHLRALRDAVGEVVVHVDVFVAVRAGELGSPHAALVVVEGLEDKRRAELAFVDQIGRLLVVRIDPDVQSGDDLLCHARVEQMIALYCRRAVAIRRRRARRAFELFDIAD